jgi:hypothetical protein
MRGEDQVDQNSIGFKFLLPAFMVLAAIAVQWEERKSSDRLDEFVGRVEIQTDELTAWLHDHFPEHEPFVEAKGLNNRITFLGVDSLESRNKIVEGIQAECSQAQWRPLVIDFREGLAAPETLNKSETQVTDLSAQPLVYRTYVLAK